MKSLLIFPRNGNALEALDCVGNRFELLGFVDDTPEKQGRDAYGHTVHSRAALDAFPDAFVLAVPGSAETFLARHAIIDGLGVGAERFVNLIHPSARVSPLATLGHNVLIMAGVVITSNAIIGNHVCILPNSVVHHDVVIGDWSLVGSNVTIAGAAVIGDGLGGVGRAFAVDVGAPDRGPLGRQAQGGRPADARRRAGHQRGLVAVAMGEVGVVERISGGVRHGGSLGGGTGTGSHSVGVRRAAPLAP